MYTLKLKSIVLSSILVFLCCITSAQDIEIKKDVVKLNDVEQFKINGGAMSSTISIENMAGKKLIFFKLDKENKDQNGLSPFILSFAGMSSVTASFMASIPFKKSIAKEIIDNDLITDGELNEDNVNRYCGASPSKKSKNKNSDTKSYIPVERNTEAPIFIINNEIKQDNKRIGKYKITTTTNNGKIVKTVNISGNDNTPIAVAKYKMMDEEAELIRSDNKEISTISIPNADDFTVIKEIAKYLIENSLL